MNKKSILIFDSDEKIVNELSSFLENTYKIYFAYNLEDATKLMTKLDFGVVIVESEIISDNLKIIVDTLERLDRFNTPIIFTAKYLTLDLEHKFLLNGADECISKPFHKELVEIKVAKQINNKINRDSFNKLVNSRTNEVEKSRETVIIAMSILAESRDDSTGSHIFRIKSVTEIIAHKYRELYPYKLSKKVLEEIVLFSPLHDIGKVSIPDTVLKKEGKFTPEDFQIMQDHTVLGGQMLIRTQNLVSDGSDMLKVAIEIAKYHHEKYDGTGYPYGLKGEQIPISARIVALADVYDALLSPRLYKTMLSHEVVVDIILNGDERIKPEHFDPEVLEAFSQCLEELKALSI